MDKKQINLLNIGFHPILLFILPQLWLISIPLNFLIDSLVLLIGLKIFVKKEIGFNYKKAILKTWGFGYVSDLIATGILFSFEFFSSKWSHESIIGNPFGGVIPFLINIFSIAIAGFFIFIFNYKIAFKNTNMDAIEKKKVALLMALLTTPYLFLLPIVF